MNRGPHFPLLFGHDLADGFQVQVRRVMGGRQRELVVSGGGEGRLQGVLMCVVPFVRSVRFLMWSTVVPPCCVAKVQKNEQNKRTAARTVRT